jgi:hypothetical protein
VCARQCTFLIVSGESPDDDGWSTDGRTDGGFTPRRGVWFASSSSSSSSGAFGAYRASRRIRVRYVKVKRWVVGHFFISVTRVGETPVEICRCASTSWTSTSTTTGRRC